MSWITHIYRRVIGHPPVAARLAEGKCHCGGRIRAFRDQLRGDVIECYCTGCRRIHQVKRT